MKKGIAQILRYATLGLLIMPSWAQPTETDTTSPTLAYPATTGPLAVNSHPFDIETAPEQKIYIDGIISGLGLWQSHPVTDNPNALLDLDNAQLFMQSTQGLLQFYVQAGGYSLPSLGTPYRRMNDTTDELFGPIPIAFIKFAPSDSVSILAGKLFTLIGNENNFTFQNLNIERGLLWNQTNDLNRGLQINYNQGALSSSLALSDGFYSGQLNWLSGIVTYAITTNNNLSLVASGNIKRDGKSTAATPLAQNNSQIYDVIYSYTYDKLTISPTIQFTNVPKDPAIGLFNSASTYGLALATRYFFDTHWSISSRTEYINTNGGTNVAYGAGSNAWSVTLTPTYQRGIFFTRAEFSFVLANHTTPGDAFGQDGTKRSQGRLLVESGILF